MSNVYYHPESVGLYIVMENDIAGSYEFDMCVLWKHLATGRLFYAFDSGCSCPSPFENEFFENENGVIRTSLQEVTARNWEGAAEEMSKEHFDKRDVFTFLKSFFAGK